jgi:acyl-CoA thioester hydrolase
VSTNANENRAGGDAELALKEFADTTIRVRYAETDQMGVVYYGNYFTWFEIGRVELCRQIGFEYKKMEIEDDSFLVVAEANCRYKRPARFDDLLTIRTRVAAAQRRTVRFAYEIIHHKRRVRRLPPGKRHT